jgi:tetratricopeptide (TPR) repeat protein
MLVFGFVLLAIGLVGASAAELGSYSEADKYTHKVDLLIATGKPSEAATVFTKLGEDNQIHGEFSNAEVNFTKALDLLKRSAQPNDLRLVTVMDDLGWLYVTWGREVEGSRLMDLAQTRADAAESKDPLLIRHLDSHAAYLMVKGRYSEAQKDWNRALEIGKLNFGPNAPQYADIFLHFGQANVLYGDYNAAAQMFRRYLQIEGRVSNTPNSSQALAAAELGRVYVHLQKLSEARPWFEEAARAFENNPDDAPLVHSIVLCYLGDYYMAQQDWNNAQLQYRQAMNLQQSVLGESKAVAASMVLLSKALSKLHLKDEAKSLTARAKAIAAAKNNPLQEATVDVLELRRQ